MLLSEKAATVLAAQIDEPVTLWGPSGQGKSALINRAFPTLGYVVEVLSVANMMPHQITGNYVSDLEAGMSRHLPPDWAVELNKHERGIIFFDDINCAPPATTHATLAVMNERRVGRTKLNAVPISAANPPSQAAIRFEMDSASANRCIHINITSDGKAFREDAMRKFALTTVPKIRENWRNLEDGKMDLVTQFLASEQGGKYINVQPERITQETVAWPSERTWNKFWCVMAACDCILPESMVGYDLYEVRRILLRGCVGKGAFEAFNKYYLDPMDADVATALKHGKAYSYPEQGDQMFALLGAVSRHIHKSRLIDTTWKQAWSFAEGAWNTAHRDRTVTFILDLVSLGGADFTPPKFYTDTVRPHLDTVL